MTEFLDNRNAEVARWQSVLVAPEASIQARHVTNHTVYTNSFLRHFISDIPPYEGTMSAMAYDWRNWPETPEYFQDIKAVFSSYHEADEERWQKVRQAAVILHEMNLDNALIAKPEIERQQMLLEHETTTTDAFLEIAAEVGRIGVDPRILTH